MGKYKIQDVFGFSYDKYCDGNHFQSDVQRKAAKAIRTCKSGALGCNISRCEDCGHTEFHNNSCRNRNCPNCQAVLTEVWIDQRKSEVIDSPYFHVVFTLPHELNPLIYCNQKLLYGLLHKCTAETLLELSADKEYLGATPGIIQVLHTWNQELLYHVHMHCIVSGGGLTVDRKIRKSKKHFSFRSTNCVINSRENILHCLIPTIKAENSFFQTLVAVFVIPTNGRNLKTSFIT